MLKKIYCKTIFRRWHVNKQKFVAKNHNLPCSKVLVHCTTSNKNHSNQEEKKQHADRHNERCWDDPQFRFHFLSISFLETAGWLGTAAALCLNYHLKYIRNGLDFDSVNNSCLFSNVLAMPKHSSQKEKPLSSVAGLITLPQDVQNPVKDIIPSDTVTLENIRKFVDQYAAIVQNSTGNKNIDKNSKRSFRCFQTAARLGSIQAFYNLGLCYQLGKGTKVNLAMAAFCYRKAAIKGHGRASFNLAIFFLKGIGGLPVDSEIALELLAEAAEKGVPEAQLYFGIERFKEKKWPDAAKIFTILAEKNMPVGQYYLGLCYENGLGVKRNQTMAVELFSKSAAQGNEKSALKISNYEKRRNDVKEPLKTAIKNIEKNNGLHVSSSVPELGTLVKESSQNTAKFSLLSYLDLTPFLVSDTNFKYKSNFIDDDKISKEYPTTFLPFRHIPFVAVQVKM